MKRWIGVFGALGVTLLLAGCGSVAGGGANNLPAAIPQSDTGATPPAAAQLTVDQLKQKGFVTVGFANENPYAYATPDGKLTGEAVEVARTIFTNLGVKEVQGSLTQFGSLIPGLNAHRFDVVTAGMFITPDRCQQAAFANPEYKIGEAIAVKKGNPKDLHSYKDIAEKGAKVAVMRGAIEDTYLQKSGVPDGNIMRVDDQPSALAALQSGRVDAMTMTGPSLRSLLQRQHDPNIELVTDFEQPVIDGKSVVGYGAAVFRKSDVQLREAYNAQLKQLKDSGQLLQILQKFGFTKENIPGDETAEQICQQ